MDVSKVFTHVVDSSGMSRIAISRGIGRNDNYISTRLQKSNTSLPRIDTLAAVGDVCGYDLLLRKREDGQEIVIDPPKRE